MESTVSVITVCKNAEHNIEKTVQSVLAQHYQDLEYIIIDGASTDGTLERLRPYGATLQIISEPDDGIYHAMNKGIQKSTGEYIVFINAGDLLLHSTVIELMMKNIESHRWESIDVIYGNVLIFDPETGRANIWDMRFKNRLTLYTSCLPHPAVFHHCRAFEKNGLYDQTFKIAGDYEWFVRGFERNHLTFRHLNILTTMFLTGGISYQEQYKAYHEQEKRNIRKMYYSKRDRFGLDLGAWLKKNKLLR